MFKSIKIIAVLSLLLACGSDDGEVAVSMCGDSSIILSLLTSGSGDCGTSEGSIEVMAEGGSGGFEYSLDGLNFQSSGQFDGLMPAQYTITVRDNSGCEEVLEVVLASGISFAQSIKPMIEADCAVSGCHVSGAQAPDLSIESNIFSAAPRIKSQVETGAMPFGDDRSLEADQIQQIICWFNDGALNN